ncbi:hypothetical protein FRB97_004079 [Tulasnella sp. 331]|nr:hypothetical protein FRB97_004079 [Tulasnella sp. 331]
MRSLGATTATSGPSATSAYLHTSSSTRSPKVTPSKVHHFKTIPDSSFPLGYLATGLHCGVKKHKDTSAPPPNDLAIILSTTHRTSSAACFTLNAFKAAPVVVSTEVLAKTGGHARALVVNSGCANAVTGRQGMQDAWAMAKATDTLVSTYGYRTLSSSSESHTLVMSTGVIGQLLPTSKVLDGISNAASSRVGSGFDAWTQAAKAFMTTDTFPKLRAKSYVDAKGNTIRFAGIDKGAGMIHPKMGPPGPPHATLLGMIATDAAISPKSLQSALTWAVERSFNSISVDGDMSTNDTIVCFANGASQTEEVDESKDIEAYVKFRDELTSFAVDLAKLVVLDGEGATKFGATSYEDAHKIASTVSASSLVKCALYGEDANWGRILCAVGYTSPLSTPINPTQISLSFIPSDGSEHLKLLTKGEPEVVDEVRAKKILERDELEIRIELGLGKESAQYYTCDLSHEYVTINGDYRS